MRISIYVAVISVVLTAPALAQQSLAPAMPMASPASPADQAFSAGMATMNHQMTAGPMTGDADQDFVAMMLPHHEGAVSMAKAELQYGKDPYLRRMARGIIAAQDQEIVEMHAWQAKHPAAK